MRALTLHRPWPWAIFHLPPDRAKRVENRTWAPPAWLVSQRLAIHAGKQRNEADVEWIYRKPCEWLWCPPDAAEDPIGIVGVVKVTGYVEAHGGLRESPHEANPWLFGPYGWILDDVVALPKPVPCRGAQGLWNLPPEVERAVLAQLGGR